MNSYRSEPAAEPGGGNQQWRTYMKMPWLPEPEQVNVETMDLRCRKYEEYAVYVTDEPTRRKMLRGISRAKKLIGKDDARGAKSHLEIVKHDYTMARHRNLVLKYRSTFGAGLAIFQLIVLCVVLFFGTDYKFKSAVNYNVFLATLGGGLGGIAIVILGLLGVRIQTSATIHRNVWFVLKPVSGCIMGLVTYIALEVAAQTLAGGTTSPANSATKSYAVFLTGFLGGFFETFANRSLMRVAKLDDSPTPSPAPGLLNNAPPSPPIRQQIEEA